MEFCYGTNKTQSCLDSEAPPQGGGLSQGEVARGLFVIREGGFGYLQPETTQRTSSKCLLIAS